MLDELWARMSEAYGRQWASSYGEPGGPAYQTWAEGLADMSKQELAGGFARCMKAGGQYAPNLPEFRKHCRPDLPEQRRNQQVSRRAALPRKKRNNSAAMAAHFEQFRRLYKNG